MIYSIHVFFSVNICLSIYIFLSLIIKLWHILIDIKLFATNDLKTKFFLSWFFLCMYIFLYIFISLITKHWQIFICIMLSAINDLKTKYFLPCFFAISFQIWYCPILTKCSNWSVRFFIISVCSDILTQPKSGSLSFTVCIVMSLKVIAYWKVLIKKTIWVTFHYSRNNIARDLRPQRFLEHSGSS